MSKFDRRLSESGEEPDPGITQASLMEVLGHRREDDPKVFHRFIQQFSEDNL